VSDPDLYLCFRLDERVGSTSSSFRNVDRNRYVHMCKNEKEETLPRPRAPTWVDLVFAERRSFTSDAGSFIRESRGRARARLLIREPHEEGNLPDGRVVLDLDAEENHIFAI